MNFPIYLKEFIYRGDDLVKVADSVYGFTSRIEEQKLDALNKKRTLLLVSGFSGAGKDSVVSELIKTSDRFGWIKTCTTRPRRPEETIENDTYIRLTESSFQKALKSGDVVESVEYAGNHYCSLTSVFEKAFETYEIPVIRIEPKGSRVYSDLWKKNEWLFDKVSLIYVFVVPPSVKVLEQRLLGRSGDPVLVDKRITQMKTDISYINDAEYIVINETGKLDVVVKDLMGLIFS